MYFVVLCEDKECGDELRARTRPAHLQYLEQYRSRIRFAGPLLKDDCVNSGGGLIVIDLEDREEALSFAQNDPYALAGLFIRTEVWPWRLVIPG